MNSFIAALFAFVVFMACTPIAIVFAKRVGLMDRPSGRKRHQAPTPLVGGIAVYLTFLIVVTMLPTVHMSFTLLACLGMVIAIGVLDDLYDVSYKIRLASHAVVVLALFLSDGLVVSSIGSVLGNDNPLQLVGVVSVLFTVVAVIGAVNVVNMSDGVDGLLISLLLVSFTVLFFYSFAAIGKLFSTTSVAAIIGGLFAFFLVNSRALGLRRALVFMGDAGSTMLGFLLVYVLIDFSQGSGAAFSPVVAGWILGLPLLDGSAVILIRLLKGKAPFYPDRNHLHHVLLDGGVSVGHTVLYLVCLHAALIFFAVSVSALFGSAADWFLFWAFVCAVFVRAGYERIGILAVRMKTNPRAW